MLDNKTVPLKTALYIPQIIPLQEEPILLNEFLNQTFSENILFSEDYQTLFSKPMKKEMANDLESQFIKQTQCQTTHIISYGSGAIYALYLGSIFPEMVKTMTLISPLLNIPIKAMIKNPQLLKEYRFSLQSILLFLQSIKLKVKSPSLPLLILRGKQDEFLNNFLISRLMKETTSGEIIDAMIEDETHYFLSSSKIESIFAYITSFQRKVPSPQLRKVKTFF